MSKLEDILQEEVSAEISAVAGEAEAKAQAILQSASQKAGALKAAKQKQLEAEQAAAIKRAESAAELVLSQSRIQAKGQVVDQVKVGVAGALDGLRGSAEYTEILTKLAEEALVALGRAEAALVHPSDLDRLQAWAAAKGLKLSGDAAIIGGVRLVAEGGKSMVQNTLSERLERSWETLSAKATKAIWG
jgi:V/A-type H+/Na+-transporting ATPase subunit E